VTYYPFDAQQCELKFASWTTEVTRVRINSRDTVLLIKPELFSALSINVFSCLDQYVDWWDRQEENPESLLSLRSIQRESEDE
jgi:hypothetical protein